MSLIDWFRKKMVARKYTGNIYCMDEFVGKPPNEKRMVWAHRGTRIVGHVGFVVSEGDIFIDRNLVFVVTFTTNTHNTPLNRFKADVEYVGYKSDSPTTKLLNVIRSIKTIQEMQNE